ncbi:ribosomal-protein-alanine N-acetyltransferase [Scopulibacillus daqui]|uniref:[Ribosomal protein bS18]-alanine N-acetyltransferase n=1 Tax=Scopulibacillus daqui TaxID=1469162 RepID=A0ABS2Q3R4_9BACL|nr:ribosomal protein S18-alanine N-acetyltransferase [Scopulibacillus daqui]MBM7646585.1 ribosomal-protein-alanine N-acetyltransferase [Scopulibacillus daqui]
MIVRSISYRFMTIEDIDQVLQVEERCFSNPWKKEAFENELLNNRFAAYLIAEDEDKIVGYCGVWVIIDEAHITNIAVLPDYRRQKIGEGLLRKTIHYATLRKARKMSLEVRVSNKAAQNLYHKLGFRDGGIRKSYYTDNHEDALVMWVNL